MHPKLPRFCRPLYCYPFTVTSLTHNTVTTEKAPYCLLWGQKNCPQMFLRPLQQNLSIFVDPSHFETFKVEWSMRYEYEVWMKVPCSGYQPTSCQVKLDKLELLALACWESSTSPVFFSEKSLLGKKIGKFLRVVNFGVAVSEDYSTHFWGLVFLSSLSNFICYCTISRLPKANNKLSIVNIQFPKSNASLISFHSASNKKKTASIFLLLKNKEI